MARNWEGREGVRWLKIGGGGVEVWLSWEGWPEIRREGWSKIRREGSRAEEG